jgi:ethanolamine utilization protein EutQ
MTPRSSSGVQLLQESDVPYEQTAPGLTIARPITAAGFTGLGGGWVKMDGSGELADWTLKYDEVLYCLSGELDIESGGTHTVAQPGQAILIGEGTTVTYRAKPGTRVFFVLYPRDWADSAE